ncbi:hypothetical protein PLEOSDRAFT_1106874 [Pleurotus ostreatus PC15]|uniref:F-box domain-containing protein n=1 Tax=Pleurotus ostreatus (strain PC15) TaxID=1137138 RepID=A0A067NQS0_PLEO1|nr:hypothetical protein PLEOSDRAFT_1106874 [Pleurotus ostreatus PC15]
MATPPALPPELWRHILSYIDSSLLLPICGVNHVFRDVALDHRHRHLWLGYLSDTKILLIQSLKDPWLAKRVKSLYLATGAVGARVDASRLALPKPKNRLGYSDILASFLPSVVRRWVTNVPVEVIDDIQSDATSMSAESLLPLLDVVLDQLKNVSELEIILDHAGNLAFELDFLRKLYCLFVSRNIQALSLQFYDYKLSLVLPLTPFIGLRKVSLTLLPPLNPSPLSADAFSALHQFLERIAPSVEDLSFATPDFDIVKQLASSLHSITMPNVRELGTPLIFDDLGAIQSMGSRYPCLSALKLYPWSPRIAPALPLGCLRLSGLRSLTLSLSDIRDASFFEPSGYRQLEELNIINAYLYSDTVDAICKFFASSSITRLRLSEFYLVSGHTFDCLSRSFPILHTLDLSTESVNTLTSEFNSDALVERHYPDWHVSVINLKLRLRLSESPKAIAPVLQRCIPNLKVINVESLSF